MLSCAISFCPLSSALFYSTSCFPSHFCSSFKTPCSSRQAAAASLSQNSSTIEPKKMRAISSLPFLLPGLMLHLIQLTFELLAPLVYRSTFYQMILPPNQGVRSSTKLAFAHPPWPQVLSLQTKQYNNKKFECATASTSWTTINQKHCESLLGRKSLLKENLEVRAFSRRKWNLILLVVPQPAWFDVSSISYLLVIMERLGSFEISK